MEGNTQEVFVQCCICFYPSRTPEQMKRTSSSICHGCLQVVYNEEYRMMVEENNESTTEN